ncbi:hypothetical protein B566_EDAN007398 [Ephemera danica]|nr:hypothetical protein B566_EDAN007398 [Ephemera danica]
MGPEMTWVIADHEAAAGSPEITVRKGQQVEVLEVPAAHNPDLCLVRLPSSGGSGDQTAQEGLVPMIVLKPPPQGLRGRRSNPDHDGEYHL